jgi:hypothetical protein
MKNKKKELFHFFSYTRRNTFISGLELLSYKKTHLSRMSLR